LALINQRQVVLSSSAFLRRLCDSSRNLPKQQEADAMMEKFYAKADFSNLTTMSDLRCRHVHHQLHCKVAGINPDQNEAGTIDLGESHKTD
jgi:hypothetical protein